MCSPTRTDKRYCHGAAREAGAASSSDYLIPSSPGRVSAAAASLRPSILSGSSRSKRRRRWPLTRSSGWACIRRPGLARRARLGLWQPRFAPLEDKEVQVVARTRCDGVFVRRARPITADVVVIRFSARTFVAKMNPPGARRTKRSALMTRITDASSCNCGAAWACIRKAG